jgi:transposase InsO family protein
MDQKTQFIADVLRGRLQVSELCESYGISRKTGYKWIDRYVKEGPAGLAKRSRRPARSPNSTPPELVETILTARRRHPKWGAKKLLKILSDKHPRWPWPQRSTVCEILNRNGLVPKKRRRRAIGHPGKPSTVATAPNELWCADYKGQFKTGDGRYCFPLTVTDDFSRYILGCHGLYDTSVSNAKLVFTRLFREFGLPLRMRTDNGVPFATNTLARLSRLSAWWVRLGVIPEFIEPGKPQQNGRHERMHKTLKDETPRCALSSTASIASAANSTISDRTKLSTWILRTRGTSPPRAKCPAGSRASSIPIVSKHATSAPTAASAGTPNGSMSLRSAPASMSGLRKSTMESGMYPSDRSSSDACLSAA